MITTLLAGLSVGAVYAIVALGYNAVYIPAGMVNFAQAAMVMLGTFVSYAVLVTWGWPVWTASPVSAVFIAVVALIIERVAVRPVQGRGSHSELVTTLGVAVLLEGIAFIIWGSQPLSVPTGSLSKPLEIFGGSADVVDILLIVIVVVLALGAHELTTRSVVGLAGLATSEDREEAALRGINVRRLNVGAFVVSGIIAGALAPLIVSKTLATISLGELLAVKGFVAFAVGGFGNIRGALFGGMLVGVVEAFGQRYVGSQYAGLLVFGLLVALLLVRPQGLFATRVERTV